MKTIETKRTKLGKYRGYRIDNGAVGDYLAYNNNNELVAGEDSLPKLKKLIDKMIAQGVRHESQVA